MFDIVKREISLLEVLEKDLSVSFRQVGENWIIDGDKDLESCPFCSHHDCFRVKFVEGENSSAFYKCFSCDSFGDVIAWRAKHKELSPALAAKDLAKEYNLKLPNDYNPVQQIFNLAANYYHNCFLETCDKPYPQLGGKTPKQYQTEVRGHKEETLREHLIGWSDGGLVGYLEAIGTDTELLKSSGLVNKSGNDFLPDRCFIYPHFVKSRVSHFTFKDPIKRLAYQLKSQHSLNSYLFYGQDTVSKSDTIAIVEGENDFLSVLESGKSPAVLATIGQISREQLEWIKQNLHDKKLLTLFDPDSAGDKYREKLESVRKFVRGVAHVKPPGSKDIDQHLKEGADLEKLIVENLVKVEPANLQPRTIKVEPPEQSTFNIPWEVVDPPKYVPPAELVKLSQENLVKIEELEEIQDEDGMVIQQNGCYYKLKKTEKTTMRIRISNFTIRILNTFLHEGNGRHREVVIIKNNGYRSEPFLIDSNDKVVSKDFKKLIADVADAEWLGGELELAGVWRIIDAQKEVQEVLVPRQIGKHETYKCWIFKNVLITNNGVVEKPDENGIFWPSGSNIGIRPQSLDNSSTSNALSLIPELEIGLSVEETDQLFGEYIHNMALNLGGDEGLGNTLMTFGWLNSCVHSDLIFKLNKGYSMLMYWGSNGDGKTTLATLAQDIFGMGGFGYTQMSQLKSAVGIMRQASYYSCLPMILDEVRSDELTSTHLPMIRSWYDRSPRVMGTTDDFKVKTQPIRSNLFLSGEDLPDDPATRERCIILRIPRQGREKDQTFLWMTANQHKLSSIGYRWILESCKEDPADIIAGIRELNTNLNLSGCSQRLAKNWASAGYFAKRFADKYVPEFDFLAYMRQACKIEHQSQATESTVSLFFEQIESAMARENPPINTNHIAVDGNHLHIWFAGTFMEVNNAFKGGQRKWGKQALLRALKDEPYYVSDGRKVRMGLDHGVRQTVLTFDLARAPNGLRNIARVNINE